MISLMPFVVVFIAFLLYFILYFGMIVIKVKLIVPVLPVPPEQVPLLQTNTTPLKQHNFPIIYHCELTFFTMLGKKTCILSLGIWHPPPFWYQNAMGVLIHIQMSCDFHHLYLFFKCNWFPQKLFSYNVFESTKNNIQYRKIPNLFKKLNFSDEVRCRYRSNMLNVVPYYSIRIKYKTKVFQCSKFHAIPTFWAESQTD